MSRASIYPKKLADNAIKVTYFELTAIKPCHIVTEIPVGPVFVNQFFD